MQETGEDEFPPVVLYSGRSRISGQTLNRRQTVSWYSNDCAVCPYKMADEGEYVITIDQNGTLKAIGRCYRRLDTCNVNSGIKQTVSFSLVQLERCRLVNKMEFSLLPNGAPQWYDLRLYNGTVDHGTRAMVMNWTTGTPMYGVVTSGDFNSVRDDLFRVITVNDGNGAPLCDYGEFIGALLTSVPNVGATSLDVYGAITGRFGGQNVAVPLSAVLECSFGLASLRDDSGYVSSL